jgi:hypothetical protein
MLWVEVWLVLLHCKCGLTCTATAAPASACRLCPSCNLSQSHWHWCSCILCFSKAFHYFFFRNVGLLLLISQALAERQAIEDFLSAGAALLALQASSVEEIGRAGQEARTLVARLGEVPQVRLSVGVHSMS